LAEDTNPFEPADDGDRRDYPESLCHGCAGCCYVHARASMFVMCATLDVKYPRQPVRACVAFRAREPA
jgi:uncharacterized cysteine cluster protein YcgN (CxxCxxCC family)